MRRDKIKESKRHIDWFSVLLSCFFVYFAYTVIGMVMRYTDVNRDYEAAHARLETAKMLNVNLREEKKGLADTAYVEKIAREELGMTKRGEMPYISSQR